MKHVIQQGIFIMLFCLAFQAFLFGQEDGVAIDVPEPIFYIREIDFDIKGQTRPFALLFNGELKEGDEITGNDNLQKYIERRTQLLINQRSLASASIEYVVGEPDTDSRVPVDLLLHIVDTWNIIALPRPQYDSNSGLDIAIKARDYNFLGTMSPLRIDLGYQYNDQDESKPTYEKHSFNLLIDSDIPFKAFNVRWNLNFDNEFAFTQDEPLTYKNTTGISLDLPWKTTTFTFGFEQGFILNELNSDGNREKYNLDSDSDYMYSKLYAHWSIPTALTFPTLGTLTYTPGLEGVLNYRIGGIDEMRRGPNLAFTHRLGIGRVDWVKDENFRKGVSFSIANSYTYNFKYLYRAAPEFRPETGDPDTVPGTGLPELEPYRIRNGWSGSLSFTASAYLHLSKLFGISGRFQYQQWFFNNAHTTQAGDVLRGIIDRRISADTMFSLNLDFPFRLIRFVPSEWSSKEKLWILPVKTFDFEMHVSPVLDIAVVKDSTDTGIDNKTGHDFQWYITGGMEIIVFPLSWRSFYLRASAGFDLRNIIETKKLSKWYGDELFIGIGHFY
jgi:outer membrane protein assembly factor BamA